MKKIFLFAFAAIVLVLAACSPSNNELTGISLDKTSIEIEVGGTCHLLVIYEPEDAEDIAPGVTWESS